MKSLDFSRNALGCCVVAAMLAGCGGSQPPIGAPGAMPQTSTIATHAQPGKSWMLAEAKGEDLLYIANFTDLLVLTYPQGKLVGTVKGFDPNASECVDAKGDVYVTDFNPPALFEYPHGGTKRIAKFLLKSVGAGACAFDPTTGNMAVSGNSSDVDIFKPGHSKPIIVNDPKMVYNEACTYDDKGNLFVDGLKTFKGEPRLAELPAGSHKFIGLSVDVPQWDGEAWLQWSGDRLAIVSYKPHARKDHPDILQFAISGTHAKVASIVQLDEAALINHIFIYEDTLILSNWYGPGYGKKEVLFYGYPSGGAPTMTLTKDMTGPRGVVVSPAAK